MKNLDIYIIAEHIAFRVEHETTVLANLYKSRGQGQIYNNIIMDGEKMLLFRTYFKEAEEIVFDKCCAYIRQAASLKGEDSEDVTQFDENLFIPLNLPDTFPEICASGIERAIYNFLIAFILYRWLEVKLPDEALIFRQKANQNISELAARLERRNKPLRRPYKLF